MKNTTETRPDNFFTRIGTEIRIHQWCVCVHYEEERERGREGERERGREGERERGREG